MTFRVAIPARYGSTRLPGKPLREIAGKPMIQRVYERAAASGADEITVVTDDARIESCVNGFGGKVCMTSVDLESGSDRVAAAAASLGWEDEDILVNLQGDEPLMPWVNIRQAAEALIVQPRADMTTLCAPLRDTEAFIDTGTVKVVRDAAGFALYFSRAPIPWEREAQTPLSSPPADLACRHIGLYGYRVGYLKAYSQAPRCDMERLECLEQLRSLWRGDRIFVADALQPPGPGVDTEADLARVEAWLDTNAGTSSNSSVIGSGDGDSETPA